MFDNFGLKGLVHVEQYRNGEKIYDYETHNMILNSGVAQVVALMIGSSTTYFNSMVVGTSTPTLSATDTSLAGAIATVTTSNSATTTSTTNDTAVFVGNFSFSSSYTLYGAMIMAGTIAALAEASIGTVTVASGDTLQITWKVQA